MSRRGAGRSLLSVAVLVLGLADAHAASGPLAASPALRFPEIGGPFRLIDGSGRSISDHDFRGRWVLLYFGYTACPDACPQALSTMAGALDALGPLAPRLQPVFVTVDPQRDTPAVVGPYVQAFDPRIAGLTGTPQDIAAVAKAFRIHVVRHPAAAGASDYSVDHTSGFTLVGPTGQFIRMFPGDSTPQQLADQLRPRLAPAAASSPTAP
jgi:protein SCO1/2